jgi:hypothetical protein
MNIDKLKEDFEFYYKYSKALENLKDTQYSYISQLERQNSNLEYKLAKAESKELESKDYEQYKGGMVKILKQKELHISSLETENLELKASNAELDKMLKNLTTRIKEYV